MKVGIKKTVEVEAKTLKMTVKCSDAFHCKIFDQDGDKLIDYEGYVPDFFPEKHYGDYVILTIDLDTGRILNWKATSEDLTKFLGGGEEE